MAEFSITGNGQLEVLTEALKFLHEREGLNAQVIATNRVRRDARTLAVNRVWSKVRYLPVSNPRSGKPVPTGIKRGHILKRVYSRRATRSKPYTVMTGYIKPIPAISLGTYTNRKAGTKTAKVFKITRKTSGSRAKNQVSRLGGVRVGGRVMPNSFVQQVQRAGGKPQIFRRLQKKTWKPGYSGWQFAPGSRQTHAREPYEVVKFHIDKVFQEEFFKAVNEIVKKDFSDEYYRALGVAAARRMNRIKAKQGR